MNLTEKGLVGQSFFYRWKTVTGYEPRKPENWEGPYEGKSPYELFTQQLAGKKAAIGQIPYLFPTVKEICGLTWIGGISPECGF
ncbi:MAG: hypothetical protein SOZ59_04125 [Candidatus Limivivens sp.]|nr:hypothetical protein [Candidatus Limivivens sp.]